MHILIVNNTVVPVKLYGGTERVIWYLGKELVKLGHKVSFLVKQGSYSDFARVIFIDETKPIITQIPDDVDIVHFNFSPIGIESIKKPYIITMHGNLNDNRELDKNTVFVSKNHAERFGSEEFVHNGLDWEDYTKPSLDNKRNYFHFLGNAAWRIKNIKGSIDIINSSKKERLKVLGGKRFNFKMGLRFTFSPKISFYGMVGGEKKDKLLNGSKGLIFPVRWHEPFGLAIIESLYFGCPVFGTPYGSLPELVPPEFGVLSNNKNILIDAIKNSKDFSPIICHNYAYENFNSKKMALSYIDKYERVIFGETLNKTNPQLKEIQTEKFLPWED